MNLPKFSFATISASADEVRESLAVAACNSEISRDPGCGAAAATWSVRAGGAAPPGGGRSCVHVRSPGA
jgi:hypothetical protein